MRMHCALLALTLPLGACGSEATVAAKETAAKVGALAQDAADRLAAELKEVDLSALAPEKLKELGAEAIAYLDAKLDEIEDSATAERVAASIQPILDSAGELLSEIGDELPTRAELKTKVDALRARFASDESVMRHLEPVLAKLSEILG